jgi:S-adenosyl methyltransferase
MSNDLAFDWADAEKDMADGFDNTVSRSARVWDYWLGGKDNFAADRAAAHDVLGAMPAAQKIAVADRAFLASVVRHLAGDLGIRQFLDIGAGLPAAINTHEAAQRVAPESRVVYVDNDPVVLAHARARLISSPEGATGYVDADARDTGKILIDAAETLDFTQPVAVLLLAVLPFISDSDDPWAITARVMDAVAPGSYLAVSHGASDIDAEAAAAAAGRYNQHSATAMRLRTSAELTRFFGGLELVAPGVVPVNYWQPGPPPGSRQEAALPAYAALGRKASCGPGIAIRPQQAPALRLAQDL